MYADRRRMSEEQLSRRVRYKEPDALFISFRHRWLLQTS
jgi:hypothetical protein